MAVLTLFLGILCLIAGGVRHCRRYLALAVVATIALFLLPATLLKTLAVNTGSNDGPFKESIENRYGIIHILGSDRGDDLVYGGNAYDGRINIDFLHNSNYISRLYMLAVVKPQPKRVLVIGMSAGSWTRVVSAFPGVETIDVVEINPGYVELIQRYEQVQPLLEDPRVTIHFDDGRRWLKRHPDRVYDLVVMNTTFHWRAYTTMLLSREFLDVLQQHMAPGAVLAYNSTYSWDVFRTAREVFDSVWCHGNFVIAGNAVTVPGAEEANRRLAALRLDGRPLIDPSRPEVAALISDCLCAFEPYQAVENRADRPLQVITEQNMLTEYRFGKSLAATFGD